MRQVPSAASGARGVKGRIFGLTRKFELTEPAHAHQPGLAVDLRGAGSALARLAIPAHREIAGLLGLDLVHHVEHDHPVRRLGGVVDELTLPRLAAPDPEVGLHVFSSTTCLSSGGRGGIGAREICMAPWTSRCRTKFAAPYSAVFSG